MIGTMLLTKLIKMAERIENSARCRKIFIVGFIVFPILLLFGLGGPGYVSRAPPGEWAWVILELVGWAAVAVWQWGAATWVWPADPTTQLRRVKPKSAKKAPGKKK
jgi:hypothetical protein